MNTPLSGQPAQRSTSVLMDARLDAMTRAKLDELATAFHRSRGAVLREVMHWGLGCEPLDQVNRDDTQEPFEHLFFLVEPVLHQQVGEAAKAVGVGVAPWLRHMLRKITVADFPRSWQAAIQGKATSRPKPRVSRRSHDSRTYGRRFMLRLDEPTWQTLESFAHHFKQSHAEIIRQLVAQARLEDFPQSWQLAVQERPPENL
jgi:hypothetical protein